ncbi:thiolase family protein [Microbacterium sp. No. 7]|uniref:thiolase family protein n=1 Tax=Microbacterium sp. No. 7 TaxID=1714373 RepID=UPI0006D2783D|nr:thiolase family protein [Microbacterium sp. No. 7]ALJ20683.1 acetyl-CoA acetyltransferase [Microbacterium sp. No. 7]
MTSDAFVIDAIRSPMGKGKAGGALSGLHPVEVLAQVFQALLARHPSLDPAEVDDIIVGCVTQVGEQSASPGRFAWLAAGLPEHVPSVTIDRKCGSGQQAIHFAAQGIMSGTYDIVIAAGIEMMSREPMGSNRNGKDPFGPDIAQRYSPGLVSQGVSAELVAAKWGLTREQMDAFGLESHRRAAAAADNGGFAREIVPISTPDGLVAADESIRRGGTLESLAGLPAPFRTDELSERFPQIAWSVTAGNSSQITDGAAAVLLVSERVAQRLGLTPRARIHQMAVVGDDPILMLTGPITATRKALRRAGMTTDDIDLFEINEAFASVPMAWSAELGVDDTRLNTRGGAIALGHPLGASGARIFATLLNALEDTAGRYGLVSICEAGGMANATIIERI